MKPKKVESAEDCVQVTWEDDHVSTYDKQWLESRSFKSVARNHYRDQIGEEQRLWGGDLIERGSMPTADYDIVMKDDKALLDWLENLDRWGVVLVKNVPIQEGPVPALQVDNHNTSTGLSDPYLIFR